MAFKLIWSEAALANLHDICTYIAQHDAQAAQRMGRGILDHVRILAARNRFRAFPNTLSAADKSRLQVTVFWKNRE